jgi:alpha-L-rhamnosidase
MEVNIGSHKGPGGRLFAFSIAFHRGRCSVHFRVQPLVKTYNSPVGVCEVGAGHFFVSFENAAFGTVEISLDVAADCLVEVHLGEKLSTDNRLEREPTGSVRYRKIELTVETGIQKYTVPIPPDERNTASQSIPMPTEIGEVMPFRYCEIIIPDGESAKLNGVSQVMVHYPFNDDASRFKCSDDTLNKVWDICKHTIKATTFCGLYVDGDRERIPYEGDAYINQLSHYCLDASYGMARATQRHFIHHPTWPTEWLLHSPLMAWVEYMYTGDTAFMEECYDDLLLRTLECLKREDGLISTRTGMVTSELVDALHLDRPPKDLVDWPPKEFTKGSFGERDEYDMVPVNTVVNAFHYRAMQEMSYIAEVINRKDEAKKLNAAATLAAKSINELLFDKSRGVYIDGEGSTHASLHANMFAVAFGLVPENRAKSVFEFIKSRGMACSVYGAQHLLDGLYEAGEDEYALSLMTARHDRSWWHMIELGSTMTMEAWDWKYKNNLDWNHAWGAAPANIIPRRLMGLRPIEPGFRKMIIQPQPGFLEYGKIKLPTPHGPVEMLFENYPEKEFRVTLELPETINATIHLPGQTMRKPFVVGGGHHELSA